VKAFDVVEHILFRHFQGLLLSSVYPLSLEHPEKTFTRGIVAAVPDRTH
jgi:hypothetical protein